MINSLFEWIRNLLATWKFWMVIPPWDVGVRIRLGKTGTMMPPGFHWRIPLVDQILLVNTRSRVTTTPTVTFAAEGQNVCVRRAVITYRITDPLTAMMHFAEPATVVRAAAQGLMDYEAEQIAAELALQFTDRGVEIIDLSLTEDVEVPAIRLIQEGPNNYVLGDEGHTYFGSDGTARM